MQKTITILITMLVLGLIIWALARGSKTDTPATTEIDQVSQTSGSTQMCYYRNEKTAGGLNDISWVRMNFAGNQITGEANYLPAERDSKTGPISGTASQVDTSGNRIANVIWTASAEGVTNSEELLIRFNQNSASLGFGEMADAGEGAYVYANKDAITYGPDMSAIDCATLDERVIVEQYIRQHITTMSPDAAVLGGTWYVTTVTIDTDANRGVVSYEDGHIANQMTFSYVFDSGTKDVSVSNIVKVEQ